MSRHLPQKLTGALDLQSFGAQQNARSWRHGVAGEEHFVHPSPGTYPRLCKLGDGSLLLGYTSFDGGHRVLTVTRSTNNGRSFEPHGEVARSSGDCDNLFLLEVPGDGAQTPTILAAFRNHEMGGNGQPTYFRVTVCQSHNGGRDWEFVSQAHEKPAPFGMWEPFMRRGKQDEVQLYFSQELAEDDQDTMLVVSRDRGRTWSAPVGVTGMDERLRDGMVGIAETKDNDRDVLVMVFETTRKGSFSVEYAISYDDGASFGSRQAVYECPPGRNAGAPQIASFADGSLAVIFMTDEDSDARAWPQHAALKATFAEAPRSGSIEWGPVRLVSDALSFWPSLVKIDDSVLLSTYESSGRIRGRLLTTD